MILLFQGSGPGADQGYSIQTYDMRKEQQSSYKPAHPDLSFYRAVDEQRLIAVRGFSSKRQEIVLVDTQSDTIEVLAWTENAGLMYPVISPDQKHIAVLILTNRRDLPPTKAAEAKLGFFPMPGTDAELEARQMTAIDVVAEDLPAIPFEWDSASRGLYYTAVSPAEIFYYDFDKRRASLIHQGLFPRMSADGNLLALIDGHNVIVLQADDPAVVVASHAVKGNPGWLAWKPDAQILAFTEELQLWRAHVNLLSIENHDVVTVFDTSRIKNLNWFKQQPGWLQYDANQGSSD